MVPDVNVEIPIAMVNFDGDNSTKRLSVEIKR